MRKTIKEMLIILFTTISLTAGSQSAISSDNLLWKGVIAESILTGSVFFDPPVGNINNLGIFQMCGGQVLLYCTVSSEFGMRLHPVRRRSHFHTGIDLSAPPGSHIFAAADGVVAFNGWRRGYGRLIEINHGYLWSTRYGHMKNIYAKKGQFIKKGDIIGEVGRTGTATGPHLHFEIIYFGAPVNPRHYFTALSDVRNPHMATANR